MLYNFLFPQQFRGKGVSLFILILRLFFGVMFFLHGVDKMMNFSELSETFPNVFGFGSYMSLMVSIFCEFCCSLFLMAGLLIRLMLLPMIAAMAVAFFDIHDAVLPQGELALIYLIVFFLIYLTGPGKYSLDYLIDVKFKKDKAHIDIK
ncbi:MAG: DoxX family protein [Bacteroidales bacterium]|nr:DoxX family protein [Bacteroidales bacterium]